MTLGHSFVAVAIAQLALEKATRKLEQRKGALTPSIRSSLDEVRQALRGMMVGGPCVLIKEIIEDYEAAERERDATSQPK